MNHCKTIALVNQKGGVGKTTSTINLGVGLASQGNKVLLVDGDPQHSLTIGLGITDPDNLEHTLNTAMLAEIEGETPKWEEGIIHHREGVDLLPANDELAGIELRLFSAMSREQVLKSVLSHVKDRYDYQTCVKLYSPQVETLRAYFKINVPNPGAIALVKTTEDGQNLSGWRFGVYSNAACTTLVSGPHTTDSSGKISITGLNAGTYYVKELGHSDSSISSRYTCSGDNPQKVSVSNGATATVSFYNKLAVGALEIRKSTNTGNHLDGWKFIVKKDGEEIPGSPFTTDETGIIRISDLAPGKYVVLESTTDDPYWTMELGYHTVTVEYGKTAVDQWLNKEQGLGYFTKSTNTGDEISGWHITVYADEACTQELHTLITGQDGTVCIYLEPGTYWVKETGSEDVRDDYWKMDDSVKQLVIRAHEKTTLEFVNNYSGRIAIRKSVEPEGTLEGWKFKITDVDGKEVSGSPFTTDKGGKILTGNLAPGDYTVEEMLPADSLYTGEAPKTVTVVAGKTAEVSFLNKLRAGRITIRKVDTNDVPLSGATFLLEGSEDGSLWYPVIPGSNGVCVLGERSEENLTTASKTSGEDGMLIWENLPTALQYRITETKAPEGYTLLKDYAFVGTLPADNTEMELRVVNGEAFALPKTGSTSLTVLPLRFPAHDHRHRQ